MVPIHRTIGQLGQTFYGPMSCSTSFLELCNIFEEISRTSKRLEIQQLFSDFLLKLMKNDMDALVPTLFLASGTIYPQYTNSEMGIGDQIIKLVIAEATGLSVNAVRNKLIKTGDLATIAMEHRVKQLFISGTRLNISGVLTELRKIAKATGRNSSNSKKNLMLSLISPASPLETKYLVRLFETRLKIGLALKTILISLGIAFHSLFSTEDGPELVKEAYSKRPDFDGLVNHILEHKLDNLSDTYTIIPGIPLWPMLAQPSKNLTKAFAKVENGAFIAEYKYDGERVQLHYNDNCTKIFSRNMEDLSIKYPDISALKLSDKSYILDGEAVAFADGSIQPFQVLSTRKKKHTEQNAVHVCIFVFDIIYYDSNELLPYSLEERQEILTKNFKEIKDKFYFANRQVCKNVEDIETCLKNAVKSSCEGVMIKSLSSHYRPSQRTNHWIKIKSDYLDNLGDSLDLVVMGAYYGKGKRTGAYGGFLLGTYNDERDKYETCCKLGTGFSDELLADIYSRLNKKVTEDVTDYIYSDKNTLPDVWIEPEYLWEVKAASISLSPVYMAGRSGERGFSLRFPRFVRERSDKGPKDASTSQVLLQMYNESINKDSSDELN